MDETRQQRNQQACMKSELMNDGKNLGYEERKRESSLILGVVPGEQHTAKLG